MRTLKNTNSDTNKFVDNVVKNKNADANDLLEKIVKRKVEKHIKKILKVSDKK